jgi:hypothetical protein
MNLVGAPNRYGLPAFFELHVWAWEAQSHGGIRRPEHKSDLRASADQLSPR